MGNIIAAAATGGERPAAAGGRGEHTGVVLIMPRKIQPE